MFMTSVFYSLRLLTITCVAIICISFCLSFPKYIFMSCIASYVVESVHFYTKAFMFIWNILFENDFPFEEHNDFIHN